ncbi:MAG TPA: trigger factor family protein, partial [Opitutales bacterium]|nr:trigger factor family protein [Opitutales bacterium]
MNHSIENLSDTRVKVTVTISADEVTGHEREALRAVSSEARIPGFRPGKAPEDILRKRFSKAITEETTRRCMAAAYDIAKANAGRPLYTLIEVSEISFTPGAEAAPVFTIDIMPKID